jgi:hypothetical protein
MATESSLGVENPDLEFQQFNEVGELDPGLKHFLDNYDEIAASGEMRQEYFPYIRGIYYLNGIYRSAYLDAKIDTARNCLKMGLSVEEVTELSRLPLETIQEIQLNP